MNVTKYVQERLGSEATTDDADAVIGLAMQLWTEQIERGMGEPDERVTRDERVLDWLDNHDWTALCEAANGDVTALAAVRAEAGLPMFG